MAGPWAVFTHMCPIGSKPSGATEASAFPVACRRLAELKPDTYSSLEALGICTVDAGSQGNVPGMAQLYREVVLKEKQPVSENGFIPLNRLATPANGNGHHGLAPKPEVEEPVLGD